ncbi:uncharacterized protein LOC117651371 [Thrips palmi]|uniref:Uncharacterized protein LOC117651371 n=1 Tax=Thrips palmi TaxID=161013 RepID=A0A6P9A0P0_THRPL|nr:uncharacterized protein LOC117651371 [Thrips palmi]
MFKLTRVVAQELLPQCTAKRFVKGHASANVWATQFSTNLSRSRARPPPAVVSSRLPASAASASTPAVWRRMSSASSLNDSDVQKRVEDISHKFKEAMELLEDARGSVGTVYFSEDMTDAENAIQEVLSDYDALMKEMNEDQKRSVVRTIGLKMEELKAQVQMLKDSLKD